MREYTIECYKKVDDNFTLITEDVLLEDNGAYYDTIYVKCKPDELEDDNEFNNNSFTFTYYGDDEFVIKRNRCELDIYIKPNLTPYDKYFYITCTHAEDNDVYTTITIIQPHDEYSLDVDNNTQCVTLDGYFNKEDNSDIISVDDYNALTDEEKEYYTKIYKLELEPLITTPFKTNEENNYMNYNYYEEKDIGINVRGGSMRYKIKSLFRQNVIDKDVENDTLETIRKKFDNGFVYVMDDEAFKIINYGKPFLEDDDYYELTLCHTETKDISLRIIIKYKQITYQQPRPTKRIINNDITQLPKSDIYLPNEEIKEKYAINISDNESNEDVEYNILFDEEIGNELVIIGKQTLNFGFKVLENGNESNLEVSCSSTAKWCYVSTDETNRNLQITIKDEPNVIRNAFVKLRIIDYPEIFVSFVVTNK